MSISRQRLRRSGFTLMEILLVAAILVILASMATIGFRQMGRSATSQLAVSEIESFENACEMYAIKHQRFPGSLSELYVPSGQMSRTQWGGPYMTDGENPPLDPWNNPYSYSQDVENDRVVITSTGPDGVASEDDISNVQ